MGDIERFKRRFTAKNTEGTAKRYANALRSFADWYDGDINDATTRDIEDYLLYMADDGYAESSVTTTRAAIKKYFDETVDGPNPAADVDLGKGEWSTTSQKTRETRNKVVYLEPDEIQQLVEHVPAPTVRNRLIIRLMFQTGVRVGELTDMRLKDIDRDRREIQIWTEKADDYRTVAYQPSLDTLMSTWVDVERKAVYKADESPYLFPSKNSDQINRQAVRIMIDKAATDAGLQETVYTDKNGGERKKITPHVLRHSFAVEAAKSGMRAPFLRDVLGHADIDVTQIYLQIAKDDAVAKHHQYGPSLD